MAKRCWPDITNFHADQLHRATDAKNKKSLPISMPYHRGHDDMPRIHHSFGRKPRAMLR